MSEESWGRSVERERDVGRSIVGRWSAERDLLWYSCLSMAPWFLQRLLRDRQALSGAPGGQGQYAGRVDSMEAKGICCNLKTPPRCMCVSNIPVWDFSFACFNPFTTNHCTSHYYYSICLCLHQIPYVVVLELTCHQNEHHVCFSRGQISLRLHCNVGADFYIYLQLTWCSMAFCSLWM